MLGITKDVLYVLWRNNQVSRLIGFEITHIIYLLMCLFIATYIFFVLPPPYSASGKFAHICIDFRISKYANTQWWIYLLYGEVTALDLNAIISIENMDTKRNFITHTKHVLQAPLIFLFI